MTFKAKEFYSGVHDWTQTTQSSKHLSVTISVDTIASLLQSVSSMFLNDARFASDGIAILLHLLTHLKPSSSENLLLEISDLTSLEMGLGELSIDDMLRVCGTSQHMQGIKMDKIIPLFAIESLDHDRYPGVKSLYLAGNSALVNCNRLDLSGLLSSEETRQQALGLTRSTPPTTANRVSNTQTQPPPTGRPQPLPIQPPTPKSAVDYPPPRGLPWKCIAAMIGDHKYCMGCHFNKPDDTPRLKFHQDVGCPALAKHGYI